jgi:hypothetical protein
MSIQNDVRELNLLNIDIKRLRDELKELSKHKQTCEERILEYLKVNNQPGLKFEGKTLVLEHSKRRKPIKKSTKYEKGTSLLEKHGIQNSKDVLDELLSEMRGLEEDKNILRIL